MGGMAGPPASGLGFVGAWGVMMAAMMLPSATPMIALYGVVSRNLARSGKHVAPTALFAATYLLVWLLFGVPVYAAGVAVGALAAAVRRPAPCSPTASRPSCWRRARTSSVPSSASVCARARARWPS